MAGLAGAMTAVGTLLVASLAATLARPVPADSDLRVGAPLVEVFAIVSREGQPVTDLQASEVEVRDHGVPQPLVAFEYVDTITGDTSESPADVVLVLDDLGTASDDTTAATTVGLTLVDALGPHDRLAVVNTGPFPLVQQLSTDRSAARSLIRQFLGQQGRSLSPAQACRESVVRLGVIENALTILAKQPSQRRAMLVISDGQRMYWGSSRQQKCPQARKTFSRIVAGSATANAPIYGIDVRGPQDEPPPSSAGGRSHQGLERQPLTVETAGARRQPTRHGSLGSLAVETGGTLTTDRNDLVSGVHHLVRDSRQYYRMAYAQPDVPRRDRDAPRQLDVQVRRSGVEVRVRQRSVVR